MAILRKHEEYICQNFCGALNDLLNAAMRFYENVESFTNDKLLSCTPLEMLDMKMSNYEDFIEQHMRLHEIWLMATKFKVDLDGYLPEKIYHIGDILIAKISVSTPDPDGWRTEQTEYISLAMLRDKIGSSMMDEIEDYARLGGRNSDKIVIPQEVDVTFRVANSDEATRFRVQAREQAEKDFLEAFNL